MRQFLSLGKNPNRLATIFGEKCFPLCTPSEIGRPDCSGPNYPGYRPAEIRCHGLFFRR